MTYSGYTGNPDEWFAEADRLMGRTDLESDRPEPMSAYEGHSHDELYRMINEDNDPGQLGDMADAWTKLANIMATFGDRLTETVTTSHTVWQGEAAEAARNFTTGLAVWSEQTGAGAQLVAHQTLYHASAAQASRYEMPEPLPSPKMSDVYQAGHLPEQQEAAVARAYSQMEAAERARLRAVEVMNDYDVQIRPMNRPSFPHPPSFGGPEGQDIKGLPGVGATSSSGTAAPPPVVAAPGGDPGPGGTTPGGATPGGPVSTRPPVGAPGAPGAPGGPGSSGLLPDGRVPTVDGGTRAASATSADTPIGTSTRTGTGTGGGVGGGSGVGGGFGSGGRGEGGSPGAGLGGPGATGGGDRNGVLGRGGLDGGAAGARGGAGAGQAGRGGLTGVPGAAGRRQSGDEDTEHESKYLDHWDNGEVWFNDMPMTSPEVIGKHFEPRAVRKAPPRRGEPKP